jgi:hypothetical protein
MSSTGISPAAVRHSSLLDRSSAVNLAQPSADIVVHRLTVVRYLAPMILRNRCMSRPGR